MHTTAPPARGGSSVAPRAAVPEPTGAPTAPRRLSPAALASYSRCPRQFRFKYVDREAVRERPAPQLTLANAVHHALERFFGLPSHHRSLEVLQQALRWAWPQHRKADTFANRDEERAWGERGLAMLDIFHETFDTTAKPVARERWVDTRLPNGVTVFGKTDRIDTRERDGKRCGLSVIDYKTGRADLEGRDLLHEPAVGVYALGCEDEVGREVETVRYLYLASGEEARIELEREDIDLLGQRLLADTDTVITDREFAARPGPHCGYCPFKLICPDAGRVELADLAVPDPLDF